MNNIITQLEVEAQDALNEPEPHDYYERLVRMEALVKKLNTNEKTILLTDPKRIHLSCDIATEIVENRIGVHLTWQTSEEGSEVFTEEAQDLFNEIYGIVQNALEQHATPTQ